MTQYLNSIYMVIIYILKALDKQHVCCLFLIWCFRYFLFSCFRLFAWRLFVFSHAVIFCMASFRREKTKRRHAKRRQDKITPSEKTKRRHAKKYKDDMRKDDKIKVSNGVFSHGVFASFRAKILYQNMVAGLSHFVFSHGVISSFRIEFFFFSFFSHGIFFCLFVFSRGVFSPRKDKKTKWLNPATITWFKQYLFNIIYIVKYNTI